MTRFSVDVSYFQDKVDDSYPHDWLIFRVCDGDFVDPNAPQNLAWAMKARRQGKLRNFSVYVVFRPGENATILATLKRLGVPTDCVIMVDIESWGGDIRGNHSTDINKLLTSIRARQNNRAEVVWQYANAGDYRNVHPKRMSWAGVGVAGYSSLKPKNPGPGPLVLWQYSDGDDRWPVPVGYPRSTRPFGRCDHNVIYSAPLPTVTQPTPATPVKPAAPIPTPLQPATPVVPIDPEVDEMFLFYVPAPKPGTFSVWERGPGVYRHVATPGALRPLIRAGAKRVDVTAAEHAATLASVK